MIELKSPEQVKKIKETSKILIETMHKLKERLQPGVKTKELGRIAKEAIELRGGKSAFLGYKGFPGSICTSINEEIVHGIPGKRVLNEGDIITVDIGVKLGDYFSDAAITVGIGNIDDEAARLVEVTRRALLKAIDATIPGNRISDISCAIQDYVEANNLSVIREFVGHGIGLRLHEDPQIPNYGQHGMGTRIKEGMVLAIEPMVSLGKWESEILSDNWTAVTKDRSLTAHFEHTVAVGKNGVEVLTEGIF